MPHGGIHNTPCEQTNITIEEDGDGACVVLCGTTREAQVFGTNLTLKRTITCHYGENKLLVEDVVTNEGFAPSPLMMLYHINFGFPFLCEDATVHIPYHSITPRDAQATLGLGNVARCEAPLPQRPEECFFYDAKTDENNMVRVQLKNPNLNFSVELAYDKTNLPALTQWKSMTSGDYALGIEPGTNGPMGRAHAREAGELQFIESGEKRQFSFSLEIIDD